MVCALSSRVYEVKFKWSQLVWCAKRFQEYLVFFCLKVFWLTIKNRVVRPVLENTHNQYLLYEVPCELWIKQLTRLWWHSLVVLFLMVIVVVALYRARYCYGSGLIGEYIIISKSEMIPVVAVNWRSSLRESGTEGKFNLWIICGLDHIFNHECTVFKDVIFEIDKLNIVTMSATGTQQVSIGLDVSLSLYETPICRH